MAGREIILFGTIPASWFRRKFSDWPPAADFHIYYGAGARCTRHLLKPVPRRIFDSRCRSNISNHYLRLLLPSGCLFVTFTGHHIGATNVSKMSLRESWSNTDPATGIHSKGQCKNIGTRQGSLRCVHLREQHERSSDPRSSLGPAGFQLRTGKRMSAVDGQGPSSVASIFRRVCTSRNLVRSTACGIRLRNRGHPRQNYALCALFSCPRLAQGTALTTLASSRDSRG